jgi:hypothetical protein
MFIIEIQGDIVHLHFLVADDDFLGEAQSTAFVKMWMIGCRGQILTMETSTPKGELISFTGCICDEDELWFDDKSQDLSDFLMDFIKKNKLQSNSK